MQTSKVHPYTNMNLKYGHPVEFINEQQQNGAAAHPEGISTRVLAKILSSKTSRISAGIILMSLLAILNVAAFFAALRIGLVFYTPGNGSGSPEAVEWFVRTDFPVCLLVSIGDDGDKPNDQAVPYSELYRLFNAVTTEMKSTGPVTELLLAADYSSLTCKMLRDYLEGEEMLDGVELRCLSPGEAYKSLKQSGEQKLHCGTVVVGDSSRYVSQLTLEWAQLMHWQNLKVVNLDEQDPARASPRIPRENWRPTVVTSFSSNHFAVGSLLIRSLAKASREAADAGLYNVSVVIYSLEEFNSTLQNLLDCVVREMNEEYHVDTELRQFNFSAHPPWMRINQTAGYIGGTGEYAWKAVMIHEVLVERGFVLWADAGGRYSFHALMESLNNTQGLGFANRNTVGVLPKWAHPGMLKYFRYNIHHNPPVPNCDGSGIGFTLDKYSSLARPWYECSITKQCIAPDGSSRDNHRQDQSALTILSSITGNSCQGISMSVKRHMDTRPNDLWATNPTKCYSDPLQVNERF